MVAWWLASKVVGAFSTIHCRIAEMRLGTFHYNLGQWHMSQLNHPHALAFPSHILMEANKRRVLSSLVQQGGWGCSSELFHEEEPRTALDGCGERSTFRNLK